MQIMLIISSLFTIIFGIHRVLGSLGQSCPPIQSMGNMNGESLMGLWYELERFSDVYEALFKCQTANYTMMANGTIDIVNTGYTYIGEYPVVYQGYGTPQSNNTSNVSVVFPKFKPMNADILVVATDYTSYAVMYSCSDLYFNVKQENAWIYGRNKTISSINNQTMTQLMQNLTSMGISVNNFDLTKQDCDN
ncbi:unnamed protein product [Medioppia subpectinata]|uniref:Lipocalin/cytosolic fatty-acid binding domain-containing protein n=1 Tax=Medioppia subpectinata TaxID=1979941 RepID=A0A7R9L0B8_9ACAR|nr:unnamed protein product [Medioppia subpectinata]CAG2111971.1 unnamed protein product [Medioppia subpectinata]